ncbi:MAG: hypothetical protein ACQXXC_05225 [Methanolinea tarda]|jgi:hypothetical protein
MSFRWPDFLHISNILYDYANKRTISPEKKEAAFRCVISRSYYSAFGHSFEYAENHLNFPRTNTGEDHKKLRDWYKSHGYPQIKRHLLELWKIRRESDYDSFINNVDIKAKESISRATQVIMEIDGLQPGNP